MTPIYYCVYSDGLIVFERTMEVRTQDPQRALSIGIRLARKKYRDLGCVTGSRQSLYRVEVI